MNRKISFSDKELLRICGCLRNAKLTKPYTFKLNYDIILNKYYLTFTENGGRTITINLATRKVVDITKCTKQLTEFLNNITKE